MATKTRTRKPREPKAKQAHLPGMDPPSITEIDEAAEAYVEVRDERMALTESEGERRGLLLELMKKHELSTYEFDGKIVSVLAEEKVKVKKSKVEEGDDEKEEE